MALVPLTQRELEHYLWEAANILRGPVDAADFKTYIFPLLFFKRICDVYDEEFQGALAESGGDAVYASFAEQHHFIVPQGHHWKDVLEATEHRGVVLQRALREIERANPNTLYGIFGDAQWSNTERFPDSLIAQLLDHFNRIRLGNAQVREDQMGKAYEYLIKQFADVANKKAGEFYTPRTIVRLMVNILDPQPGESIYDPACGTGGMLLEAVQHVREQGREWRNLIIRGQEKNLTTQSIARMNLFLHGIEDFEIARGDTLRDPAFHRKDILERFDCVIANPPFSLSRWGSEAWSVDPYRRNLYGLPPESNGDYAWLLHMLTSMHPDRGRMAVVLPHGTLFRGGKEGKIRLSLLRTGLLDAVIGLGSNLFYGTGIPAAILIFRARPDLPPDPVLFIDASEFYSKGRAQNLLTAEQADAIYDLYRQRNEVEGVARLVPLHKILEEHDGNLNIARYIQRQVKGEEVSVAVALETLKARLDVQEQAEDRLWALIRREGF
ncbi:MAG: SAM-dependent DNA methyltransferase [Ardenticatenales bacterium]|nr:SAM-dependent DNA methyltransferase [Ardenticatenales bacterium]